jgi:AcrR family transcriptional regulator
VLSEIVAPDVTVLSPQTDLSDIVRKPVSSARERLLDRADDLFYREGIRAVGIDRIIAESHIAKASLYAHFASKDELIGAYLARRSARWQSQVEAELADVDDPTARILRVFDLLAASIRDPNFRGCPFIKAASEFPTPDHPARMVTDRHRAWLRTLFVHAATASGADDPQALARALVLLYDGALVAGELDNARTAGASVQSAVRQLIEQGMRRTDRRSPRHRSS